MSDAFSWLGAEPTEYEFYNGQHTLYFDENKHSYFRYEDDAVVLVPGVTSIVAIVDKSQALMNWSSNMCSDYIAAMLDANPEADAAMVRTWLDKARVAHRDYKEDAANVGKIAHDYIEHYIEAGINGYPILQESLYLGRPDDERAANAVTAAFDWMAKHHVQWIFTERKIYHRHYDYAGTLDGLCRMSSCDNPECCGEWQRIDGRWKRVPLEFRDVLAITDWKSSNSLHTSYRHQVAGYTLAIEDEIGALSDSPELDAPILYRVIIRLGKEDGAFESMLLPPSTLIGDKDTFVKCLALYRAINAEETQDKERRQAIRQQEKEDRDEQRKIACPKSETFKGYRFPRCNDGPPCQTCLEKFYARHPEQKPTEDTDVLV